MKTFNLTILGGGDNPKVNKVLQTDFKAAMVDFPQALAERLVELGWGKWLVTNSTGNVLVPVGITPPEQLLFIKLKTHALKAAHINSFVGGPVAGNLVTFGENLIKDIGFVHDPIDLLDEEDELYDTLLQAEEEDDDKFVHDPTDLLEPTFDEEDELYDILEPLPVPDENPQVPTGVNIPNDPEPETLPPDPAPSDEPKMEVDEVLQVEAREHDESGVTGVGKDKAPKVKKASKAKK